MRVKLISWTPHPDILCNIAARACTSQDIPDMDDHDATGTNCAALCTALRSGHESVIEHATFTFAIEGISRACSHQLVRHRMASYSQQSQRYVKMSGKVNESQFDFVTPESFTTTVIDDYWNTESGDNSTLASEEFESLMESIGELYERMINAGIPEEDARYVLPNACCTNLIMTMNARELRHFLRLRLCRRAQWEIRELAERMLACVDLVSNMFADVGPACEMDGKCPERRPCGRPPSEED